MRRLLPFALLLAACAKAPEAPPAQATPKRGAAIELTPEALAQRMGVPFYPGAEAPEGMSAASDRPADGSTVYSLVLATKDKPEKVAAWYAAKLGLDRVGSALIGRTKTGQDVTVGVVTEAGGTMVRIKSIAYKTR